MTKKTKKVLIVEDEQPMAEILRDCLMDEGFIVVQASNGQEGLEHAFIHRPDIIILDIVMPEKNGLTLLKELRQDSWGQTVPVILLSNVNSIKTIIEALEFDEREGIESNKLASLSYLGKDCVKTYLEKRLPNGVYDFFVKTDCSIDDVIVKIKERLQI